ncbi:MAG: PPOX class F420-dependent oxidoreductase [Candidatus Dormibacteria bacterium]
MDKEAARDFVRQHHNGVLATTRRDGSPQLSPISVGVDSQGRLIVSTREPSMKVRNLRRDPHYDLVVLADRFYGPWISARGTAEIVALPEALPLLVDYYRLVAGEHPDWDDYRQAMVREQRVLLQLSLDRVGPNVSG